MKKFIVFVYAIVFVLNVSLAQETASSATPPSQPEFIKGKERYFFQIGSLNTSQTDTLRNVYKNRSTNYVIGIESVISRYVSLRFALGYSGWNVNSDRAGKLLTDSIDIKIRPSRIDVEQHRKMEVISINPDMKIFYPGSTRVLTGYASVGFIGYFTIQRAIVKAPVLNNVDQSLTPISSLNATIGIGGEYHINDLLMVYAEAKYGHELLNFSVPNNSKWINTSIALGVAVKFGNE